MMDEVEKNVKIIIEPYERRIKELEETIRKKDFEIAVLKQKIFNINNNQNHPIIFGNNNNYNYNNYNNEKINIKFIDNNNNKELALKCKLEDKTKKILERYLNDSLFEIRDLYFIYNNSLLKPYQRIYENGLNNNSIITVKSKKLMSLIFRRNGYCIALSYEENTPVGMAFIYYLLEIEDENNILNLINNEKPISFIYNQQLYSIKDKTSIKDRFKHQSRIEVIEHGNIIGGKNQRIY